MSKPGLTDLRVLRGNFLASSRDERFEYNTRHHLALRERLDGSQIRYQYDSFDMLVAIEHQSPDGDTWRWEASYDALGRRIRARLAGKTREFYWDHERLAAEIQPDGRLRIYQYASRTALIPIGFTDYDNIDAKPESGRSNVVFADPVGMPLCIEDQDGNIVWWAQRVDPYGTIQVAEDSSLEYNLRWPGHYYDPESGLHYNRWRYYDPVLGRYLQSDPLGYGGSPINLYAYASNPLVQVDLFGLECEGAKDGDAPKKKGNDGQEDAPIPEGGVPLSARKDAPKKLKPPEHYYYDPAAGKYKLRPAHADGKSAREQHYPSGFRQSTHETMAARHTQQGKDQMDAHRANPSVPAPPPVLKKDADGNYTNEPYNMNTERNQLNWQDAEGNDIDYYERNPDGSIKHDHSDPPRPVTNVTYDHDPPLAQRYNDGDPAAGTRPGHQATRAERIDDFNDPGTPENPRLTPRSRADNSSLGSRGQTYDNAPEGDYFK